MIFRNVYSRRCVLALLMCQTASALGSIQQQELSRQNWEFESTPVIANEVSAVEMSLQPTATVMKEVPAPVPTAAPIAEAPAPVPTAAPIAKAPAPVPAAPIAEAPAPVPAAAPIAKAPAPVPAAPIAEAPAPVPAAAPIAEAPAPILGTLDQSSPLISPSTHSLASAFTPQAGAPVTSVKVLNTAQDGAQYWTGIVPRSDGGGLAESRSRLIPATSLTVPSGFAGGRGACFFGVALSTNRPPASTDGRTDGAAALGCGYGDPSRIGGTIMYSADTIGVGGRKFNASGSFSASIGHNFESRRWGVNLRVTNILGHSSEYQRNKDLHWALALSRLFSLGRPGHWHDLVVNTGVGNGYLAYEPEKTLDQMSQSTRAYIGAAYGLSSHVSVIAEDANGMVAAGLSFVPSQHVPCIVNVFKADCAGKIPDHASGSWVISTGCAIRTQV